MRVLHVDAGATIDAGVLTPAVEVLREGGAVAYPTDTLYGIAVDAVSPEAVDRLFRLKERDPARPLPLIAGSLSQAEAAAVFSDADRRLAAAFWPGPLSLIVKARDTVAPGLVARDGTIAVRVPDHAVARRLAEGLGRVITATSANISGRDATMDAAGVAAALGDRIDLIVDGGPAPGGPPSTIVEMAADGPRLVRAGAVAWERVLEFLA